MDPCQTKAIKQIQFSNCLKVSVHLALLILKSTNTVTVTEIQNFIKTLFDFFFSVIKSHFNHVFFFFLNQSIDFIL